MRYHVKRHLGVQQRFYSLLVVFLVFLPPLDPWAAIHEVNDSLAPEVARPRLSAFSSRFFSR